MRVILGDGSNNDSFEYVPLFQSLKALLQHPEICDEVCLLCYTTIQSVNYLCILLG